MPSKAKRQCKVFGCKNYARGNEAYCEEHLKQDNKKYNSYLRKYDANERYDSRWNRVRNIYIKQHPLCEECFKENKYTKATIVHHKKPIECGGDKYDIENLESVCDSCHQKIHSKIKIEYKF